MRFFVREKKHMQQVSLSCERRSTRNFSSTPRSPMTACRSCTKTMALLEPEASRPWSPGAGPRCHRSVLMILWCCWMLHSSFILGGW